MAHAGGGPPIVQEEYQLAQRTPKRTISDYSDSTLNSTTPSDFPSSPSKRRCTSSPTPECKINTTNTTNTNTLIQLRSSQLPLHSILHLPESALWSLCKGDLRTCFLALQSYARSPYPLTNAPSSLSAPTSHPAPPVPDLLRLPLEIRQQIYALLIPAPVSPPMRGPHPRQLQNPLHLTQPIPASLLLLNHQIRLEALPVLYGAQTQTAYVVIDYNLWAHKTKRSDLVLSNLIPSSLRHVHVTLSLGSEKRPLVSASSSQPACSTSSSASPNANNSAPKETEASTRLLEIKKGIKKLLKWLGGADIKTLTISWQEPPQTYAWTQKREVLEGLRKMNAVRVREGEINWGLEEKGKWNRGRRYRWEHDWVRNLERGRIGVDGS